MDLPSPPSSSSASISDDQSPESPRLPLPPSPSANDHLALYSGVHSADSSFSDPGNHLDWGNMVWHQPGAYEHGMHDPNQMEIDPQLLGVDPAAVFSAPAVVAAPLGLATPSELAGLAPLLEAFPFEFDVNRYAQKQHLEQPALALHTFTPSPSPESQGSDDIARMAREKAGIMHAIISPGAGLELNIPQMTAPRHIIKQQPSPSSSSSSTTGSPPPATPLDPVGFAPSQFQSTPAESQSAPKPRPKTSHTTIERRYRTNLNARIVALRAAVPATAHIDAPPGAVELDARGRADGVTPARKGSKATILAKAVEYIAVLRAREVRLRRDAEGLKNLVRGLVGGEQLLNAWDIGWKAKWGTMEDDEARLAGESLGSDDDDSDEEDSRPAKKSKKAPVSAVPIAALPQQLAAKKTVPGVDPVTGEKRKRGRPRKNPVTPATQPVQVLPAGTMMQQQHLQMHQIIAQPQPQYLLAVFALFSLWSNVPTSTPTATSHEGSVVADVIHPLVARTGLNVNLGWIQAVHLVASVVVLFSVVVPIIRHQLRRSAPVVESPAAVVAEELDDSESESVDVSDVDSDDLAASLISSLSAESSDAPSTPLMNSTHEADVRLADEEREVEHKERLSVPLAQALGATGGVKSVLGAGAKFALSTVRVRRTADEIREADGETVDGWARLAEAFVVEGDDAPLTTRLQAYLTLSAARPRKPAHRAALALLAHSLGLPDASRAWQSISTESATENCVLSRMSVEDAADALHSLSDSSENALRRLARDWLRTEAQIVARDTFMSHARGIVVDPERADELRAVGAELGGQEERLALAVSGASSAVDFDLAGDVETEDIVRALALFEAGNVKSLELLQVLGRPTFDAPELEDARDRMVDLVRANAKRRVNVPQSAPIAVC